MLRLAGLAEVFDQRQRFNFGDLVTEARDQKTDESFLGSRAGGAWFAQMFQDLFSPIIRVRHGRRLNLGPRRSF